MTASFRRSYRVIHGPQGSAGQPAILAAAQRKLGVEAGNFIVGANRYGFAADYCFTDGTRTTTRRAIAEILSKFDIIHLHAITPLFVRGGIDFPMGTDLLALRAAGKRILMHFRGSEIRMSSIFRKKSPYHYVEENPEGVITRFPEQAQRDYVRLCSVLCDAIIVSDPELQTYVPGVPILPRAIDLSKWPHAGPLRRSRPLVVHAPSRQGVKGTRAVLAAVDSLKTEGVDFEFQLVEGLPQEEARKIYQRADIIVDQLRIGWYGVLAMECMALGKAVASYIRDDIQTVVSDEPPLAVANPDTIADVLRRLIIDADYRQEIANRGHRFCVNYHDSERVAQQSIALYDRLLATPPSFDLKAYMEVNELQDQARLRALKDMKQLGAQKALEEKQGVAAAGPPGPALHHKTWM
jgi:glycosyltransferase involved in cell wall biosynthesis